MARAFTTTGKVAPGSWAIPTTLSLLAWVKAPDTSVINANILQNDTDTYLFAVSGTSDFRIHRDWTTTVGIWTVTAANHGMTLTNWNHVAVTYDGGSAANTPVFYANGVSSTVTTSTPPVGTLFTSSGAWTLGNESGGTLPLGGSLAYVSVHNVVLTAGEVNAAMVNGFTTRGLIGFWPLLGDATEPDYSGLQRNGTVTGTTVVSGPPIRPSFLARPTYSRNPVAAALAQFAGTFGMSLAFDGAADYEPVEMAGDWTLDLDLSADAGSIVVPGVAPGNRGHIADARPVP